MRGFSTCLYQGNRSSSSEAKYQLSGPVPPVEIPEDTVLYPGLMHEGGCPASASAFGLHVVSVFQVECLFRESSPTFIDFGMLESIFFHRVET